MALGSTRRVREWLGKKIAIKGTKVRNEVRNLGVGFAFHKGGKRRLMQGKRWQAAKARTARLSMLGARGRAQVPLASVTPSITDGVGATGMRHGMLTSLR